MPRISTDNYDTVASWNGSQDLFVVEQPDGTKVATPAMVKQYVLGNSIDDIYSVMGEMGAKNLFNSQYSVPRTNAGTTATLGDDGHVILNGTANADAAQLTRPGTTIKPIKDLKVGDKLILSYKVISGTFTHGSSSNASTLYFNNKNGSAVDPIKFPLSLSAGDSDSKEIELTNECFTDGTLDLKDIQIYMRSGDTFNNLELAIMLRLASDTDNTYEPYAMTNKQLTDELDTAREQIAALENIKVAEVSATMTVSAADPLAIGGHRSVSSTSKVLSTFTGYPTGKTKVAEILYAFGANAAICGVVNVINGVVYLNTATTGDYIVHGYVFYKD